MRALKILAICTVAYPCLAYAQSAAPSEAADNVDSAGGEIVVTATRQSESISRVPLSIAAITQEAIDSKGIRNFDDVARFTPGITFTRNAFGSQSSVSIRGISSDIGAGTVGVYVDDTPIQTRSIGYSSTNLYPQLFDLERVEVLRGPQGTLFGAGSMGGTIRFITPDPDLKDVKVYSRAEVGAIQGGAVNYEAGAAVNLPLIQDKVALRISASHRHDGGWIDRVDQFTGKVIDKNTNYQNSYVVRAALGVALSESITVTPSILYQNTKLHDAYSYWDALSTPSQQEFRSGQALRQPDHERYVLPALKIEYDGPGFSIISDTSYFSRHHTAQTDYTNLIAGIYFGTNRVPGLTDYTSYANMDNKYKSFTQELRIQSSDANAKFTWVAGLFYNNLKQAAKEDIVDPRFGEIFELFGSDIVSETGQSLVNGVSSFVGDYHTKDRQFAAFGEVSYEIVDGLRARAGLRYSISKFSSNNFVTGPFNYGTTMDNGSGKEKPLTPKFNLTWQIDPANMIYATASKGFRIGGVNPSVSNLCATDLANRGYDKAPTVYGSDSLWSYEVGTKNRLFGGATQVAASVFHVDWKNIQQNVYLPNCAFQFTDNLGSAKSNGFDLEFSQRVGNFNLNVSAGYTSSKFSRSILGSLINGGPERRVIVRKGNALQSQPWTVVVGGQYDLKLADKEAYLRADYNFIGGDMLTARRDPTTTSFNPNVLNPAATNTVNARFGITMNGLDVSLFATNLFNDHPPLSHYAEGGDPIFRETTVTPRTIGLTASYRL